ncbi:hypothetical protein BO78DRAFT_206325 [Aspergillus sclerotiicarbonarius CBS 121057]|uniref:C2H2-type domain-containing protein n=1 Tax=Aspergillus sclerotiicarbonarius (strain CBS 121057 / IBT 28362) TaxID=1448318 RepID=A0A319E957_ASPSB|nr:hypothetical protein BO78DRAFT_206325 [Aspergillus sclerotiicarbonarius CBS 121057]
MSPRHVSAPGASAKRRFPCSKCERSFTRREHLQRHENIHCNRKPFQCSLCSYACRRQDLLNRHVKLTHANEGAALTSSTDEPEYGIGDISNLPSPVLPESQDSLPGGSAHQQAMIGEIMGTTAAISQPDPTAMSPPPLLPSFLASEMDAGTFPLNYLNSVCLPPSYPELWVMDPPSVVPALQQGANDLGSPPLATDSGRMSQPPPAMPDLGRSHVHVAAFLRVTQDDWLWLSTQMARFVGVLPPNWELPSRHALSRYLHGFMNGFHPHFPIIHPPTLRFRDMAPELILALAAVGSHYCFESHQGLKLAHLAQQVALKQIGERDKHGIIPIQAPSETNSRNQEGTIADEGGNHADAARLVESMQALFFVMALATWGGENRPLVRQGLALPSVLAMLVRQHGLTESPTAPMNWHDWARDESARRTKLVIFCFFNLQAIAFNLPSPILVTDMQLKLPCAEMEWKAADAADWQTLWTRSERPPSLSDSMAALIQETDVIPVCSSLGSHILIHALLQRIISIQHSMPLQTLQDQMFPGLFVSFRRALRKWQQAWEQNPESSYSPLDKHGPIAFNSTALLHLAYTRLAVNIGPARSLLEQPPLEIAQRLANQPSLPRGSFLSLAARHATAALCAPVQMGVHFVGRAPSWSVMHAVCSLEYAYILNQFIQATAPARLEYPLESDEDNLLATIKYTLREVESSTRSGNPESVHVASPQLLGAKVVRAWATILEGTRTWCAVDMISRTLFAYADLLAPRP